MDIDKKAQELKEIADIKSEYNKIEQLLMANKQEELSEYLGEIYRKYMVETAIYNFSHPIPAKNVQQNAVNCMSFLKTLEADKVAKSITED